MPPFNVSLSWVLVICQKLWWQHMASILWAREASSRRKAVLEGWIWASWPSGDCSLSETGWNTGLGAGKGGTGHAYLHLGSEGTNKSKLLKLYQQGFHEDDTTVNMWSSCSLHETWEMKHGEEGSAKVDGRESLAKDLEFCFMCQG